MKKIILALMVLSLTACGGDRVKTVFAQSLIPEETHLEGIKQTVYVGDTMTSSAPLIVIESAVLKKSLTASTSHKGRPRVLTAGAGSYGLVRQNELSKFYEATSGQLKVNNEIRAGGLMLSRDGLSSTALYWTDIAARDLEPNRAMKIYLAELNVAPEVTISTSKRPPNNHQGFVATLTYTGMAGGQIKFVYREYNDGFARAAFTQEVSLDYVPGKTYVYKAAQFVVHEASTTEVTFTLMQSL